MDAIAAGVSILGAWLYYKFGSQLNLRRGLIWSICIGSGTALAYLYFTPTTDIIYRVAFSVVGMFFHLMIMTVMAQTCIKGLESTSFATLCAVSNIAGTASTLTGAYFLPIVGLQYLIVMSAVTSLVCLPLLNVVMPKEQK
jgi:predicted MFS family arabinose efflux permease